MSTLPMTPYTLPSLRATIIRSFRWKTFEHGDMSKFPAKSVFWDIMQKYHCKKPQTVARKLMRSWYDIPEYDRKTFGKIMSATQFLKTLQFMRYNYGWENEDVNNVIRRLSEWLVSRTPEYEKAKWDF